MGSGTLAELVERNRARLFVGRQDEFQTLAQLLSTEDPLRVWFLHGPGGIGKTAFVDAAARRARDEGFHTVSVDARVTPSEPERAEAALNERLHGVLQDPSTPVLLSIDTVESWSGIEQWLHTSFMPSLPASVRVLLAGRKRPHALWRGDSGWAGLFRHSALAPLSQADCVDYLERRGVDPTRIPETAQLSHGSPLLLALAADALEAGGRPPGAEPTRSEDWSGVVSDLVDRLIPPDGSSDERSALYAASFVRFTTPALLAAMLDAPAARSKELFEWLGTLSFMERAGERLFPHDLVRDALCRVAEARDPELRLALLRRAATYYLDRVGAGGSYDAEISLDNLYLFQNLTPLGFPLGEGEPFQHAATESDHQALRATVESLAPDQLEVFDFWWSRRMDDFRVVRDAERDVAGFFLLLQLDDAMAGDPLVDRFWQEGATLERPLEKGDTGLFLRLYLHRTERLRASNVTALASVEMLRSLVLDPRVVMFGATTLEVPEWMGATSLYAHRELQGSRTQIGSDAMRVVFHDFSVEHPVEWLRSTFDRLIEVRAHATQAEDARGPDTVTPTNVRALLRHLHRPDRLAEHPLLERFGGAPDRMEALRSLVLAECAALETNPKTETLHRVLDRTYLRPSADQRAAAEACHLSWDQYRRRLTEAIKLLTARLQERIGA